MVWYGVCQYLYVYVCVWLKYPLHHSCNACKNVYAINRLCRELERVHTVQRICVENSHNNNDSSSSISSSAATEYSMQYAAIFDVVFCAQAVSVLVHLYALPKMNMCLLGSLLFLLLFCSFFTFFFRCSFWFVRFSFFPFFNVLFFFSLFKVEKYSFYI